MLRADFYFVSKTLRILHQFTFNLEVLPKEGEIITVDNIFDPTHRALIGKVQKVAMMLNAASGQEVQNKFLVIATILDYVEEDVITVLVRSQRLN